jgi:hypothetical protein
MSASTPARKNEGARHEAAEVAWVGSCAAVVRQFHIGHVVTDHIAHFERELGVDVAGILESGRALPRGDVERA